MNWLIILGATALGFELIDAETKPLHAEIDSLRAALKGKRDER